MKKIVVTNNKVDYIKMLSPLTNVKVMSLKEVTDKVFGSYDNEARLYCFLTKHLPLNVIDVYLENLKYITAKVKDDEKISFLYDLKQELIQKKLYYYDQIFLKNIANMEFAFIDMDHSSSLAKLVNYLSSKTKVSINYRDLEEINKEVFEYRSIEDEVNETIYEIMNLLEQGVSLNRIKLMNVNDDYHLILTKVLNDYHLPFIPFFNNSLYATNDVINFIKSLDNLSLIEATNNIKNIEIKNSVKKIINQYAFLDDIDLAKPFIINDLKLIKMNQLKKDIYLETVDLSYNIRKDDIIFFLNFNNGSAPKISLDNAFLDDQQLSLLGVDTSSERTSIEENKIRAILNKCHWVSYKLLSNFASYSPSYMVSKYKIKVIRKKSEPHYKYYSLDNEIYRYGLSRDYFNRYKIKDHQYDFLAYNFKKYVTLKDYRYQPIDINVFRKYLNNQLQLSYSKLDDYFKCKYMYYLKHILKLESFDNTLATTRGKVYHRLLEECNQDNFNYDDIFDDEIKQGLDTNQTRFLISLIDKEFAIVKKYNDDFMKSSMLHHTLMEKEVLIKKIIDNIDITIKGFIDKIIFNDNELILVDYKTGKDTNFDLNLLYYGLNLQLPMYAYYMNEDNQFKHHQIAGLYLQHIYQQYNDKELQNVVDCEKKYRLCGYSNEALLETISNEDKKFIKSKNLLSSIEMKAMIKYVSKKVDEALNEILNANFEIDPKMMKGKIDSCEYCPFEDICHNKNNKRIIQKQDYQTFLGGDNNGI